MGPGEALLLVAGGVAIGVYSTALGAGGAFITTPLLLLLYPEAPPALIAAASLFIVVISSGLSAIQAVRRRRVDPQVIGLLILAVVPAAVFGAAMTSVVPRRAFEIGFALLLVAFAAYIWFPPRAYVAGLRRGWARTVIDNDGQSYRYVLPVLPAVASAAGVSFISSLAGIGGGPLYTPLEVRVMHIPIGLAVPFAHVVITALAAAGLAYHLAAGHVGTPFEAAPWLALGMVGGNPVGRRVNDRLREGPALRLLAAGMLLVSVRTAFG